MGGAGPRGSRDLRALSRGPRIRVTFRFVIALYFYAQIYVLNLDREVGLSLKWLISRTPLG